MKRTVVLILFSGLFLAALPASVTAEVFERDWRTPGDGLLTYDDVNQREWLDLTETQLFKFPGDTLDEKYRAVLAETAQDGVLAGFAVATTDDVTRLAASAGIDTENYRVEVNGQETFELIDLLGDAGTLSGPMRNRISSALTMEHDLQILVASIVYAPGGLGTRPGPPVAGLYPTDGIGDDDMGVWFYRNIPEPASFWLLLVGCMIIAGCKR